MEDEMFRRLEHKQRKETVDETTSTDTSKHNDPSQIQDNIDGVVKPVEERPSDNHESSINIISTNNRISTDDPLSTGTDRVTMAEDMEKERSAVEIIFGPNNRKKRKEAQKLAVSEGKVPDSRIDDQDGRSKSAVDVIFGPNNKKKREEAQARARAQGLKVDELGNPVYPEHKKTAVEAILGPNNKKYRKEAQAKARAEGKTVDEYGQPVEPQKTAVEIIFGPNNRKKRKEAARMERQTDNTESEESEEQHGNNKRIEL